MTIFIVGFTMLPLARQWWTQGWRGCPALSVRQSPERLSENRHVPPRLIGSLPAGVAAPQERRSEARSTVTDLVTVTHGRDEAGVPKREQMP